MDDTSQMPPIRGVLTVVQIAGDVPEGGLWVGDLDLEGQEVIIGRLPSSDITLQGDSLISRRHAKLFRKNNDYFVEDLGSSNGTYLNGEFLSEPCRLVGGETIGAGLFEIRYRRDDPEVNVEDDPSPRRESTNSLKVSAVRRLDGGDLELRGSQVPSAESAGHQESSSTAVRHNGRRMTSSEAVETQERRNGITSEIDLLKEQVRTLGQLIRERADDRAQLIDSLQGTNAHLYFETLNHINEVLFSLLDAHQRTRRVSELQSQELVTLARETANIPGNVPVAMRFAGRSAEIATVLYELQISGIGWDVLRTLSELQRHVANMLQAHHVQYSPGPQDSNARALTDKVGDSK